MADIKIERTELAVTFLVPGYKDLPDYRDTLHLDPSSDRTVWVAEAKARHAAWADAIRNPPEPESVAPEDIAAQRDDALAQARVALQQAMEAIDAVPTEETTDANQ